MGEAALGQATMEMGPAVRAAYQHPDLNEMAVNIQDMLIQPPLRQP